MKILMVYPEYPLTFWGFKHALRFISKRAAYPPLGLLTVAAMLPKDWDISLLDMNVEKLRDRDLDRVDYVMISAMLVQKDSVDEILERCGRLGVKV
ncbi:MAG: B12-binding domain-containing radical SAM protein, partial [Deltaproteobacteria bacterium]|nr:B12-binding domain-containing radical SAM protein [Deltaproteobacteria bacterium]